MKKIIPLLLILLVACSPANNNNNNNSNNSNNNNNSSTEVLEPDVWTQSDINTLKSTLLKPLTQQERIEGTNELSEYTGSWSFEDTNQNNSDTIIEYLSMTYRTDGGIAYSLHSDISRTAITPGSKYKMKGFCSDNMTEEEFKAAKCVEVRIETRNNDGTSSIIELEPETQAVRLNNVDLDSMIGQPKTGF